MIYMYMISGHVTPALGWLVQTMDNCINLKLELKTCTDDVEKIHLNSVSFIGKNRLYAIIMLALMNVGCRTGCVYWWEL